MTEPIVWADEASPFTGAEVKALLEENSKLRRQLPRCVIHGDGGIDTTKDAECFVCAEAGAENVDPYCCVSCGKVFMKTRGQCTGCVRLRHIREAATSLHDIASATGIREMRVEHLSAPLYASLAAKKMTDKEIMLKASDAFEKLTLVLHSLGEPEVAIFNCGSKDITP